MNYVSESFTNPGKYTVVKGPTILYKQTRHTMKDGIPLYNPYTADDGAMLVTLRDAITGDKRARESKTYKNTVVRSGWIEPGFNSLKWLKLSDLVEGYYYNTLTPAEKRKLMEVCRLLFISVKEMKRLRSDKEIKAHSKLRIVA